MSAELAKIEPEGPEPLITGGLGQVSVKLDLSQFTVAAIEGTGIHFDEAERQSMAERGTPVITIGWGQVILGPRIREVL